MKNKLIALSDQEIKWVQGEANKREITFSDMLRRIIDDRYEKIDQNWAQDGSSILPGVPLV